MNIENIIGDYKAFFSDDNEKIAKFYDISLNGIVTLQGWKIEKI